MGVDAFATRAEGLTLDAAFEQARAEAAREHGTSPYAGTVYNKDCVELFDESPRLYREASARAVELMDLHHHDTSSPAGALPLITDGPLPAWLLFGHVDI
ncbi:hypothetical protein [Streptomyces decoyicus]|uniref:hypothetical protein n=1 Tax=Streptomyces decoyicus TaxID=249567 RepID=UPI00365CC512